MKESIQLSPIDKFTRFIKYLYEGEHIKIDGKVYCMTEDCDLGLVCLDENMNELEKCLKLDHISTKDLFDLASKVTDEEYYILEDNKVLRNQYKRD